MFECRPTRARPDPARARACAVAALAAVAASLLAPPRLAAQGQPDEPEIEARVNYVYATQFGFGGYKVGGLRTDVYSLPIGFTVADVLEDWDLQIGLPITYGRFRFSDGITDETGETFFVRAETNTIAVEPRLQLDIPIHWLPGFRVSPIGAFGFGSTFSSSGSVQEAGARKKVSGEEAAFYTYQIGISSVYERRWNDFTFLLGNAFIYAGDAGFDDDLDDEVEGYGTYRAGIEGRYPLPFDVFGYEPDAGVFFVYNLFTPSLEFTRVGRAALEIDQIFEVGATIGAAKHFEVEWLPGVLNDALDEFRIGIGYQSGEDLDGVRLTFGAPF